FKQLGVSSSVAKRLESRFNITQPTLAQQQFIPALVSGQRDLLLRDQTGTGKTFGTAVALASLVPHEPTQHVKSLYIVSNQELAYQITYWIQQLTDSTHVHMIQPTPSSSIPHTLIGTPGRLLDTDLSFDRLDRLVVDEVDQALALPKRYASARQQHKRLVHPKPTERLLDQIQRPRQTMVSSATLNRPLRHFLIRQKAWLHDPLFIQGDADRSGVKHHCLMVSDTSIRNIAQTDDHSRTAEFDDTDDRMIESIAVLQELEQVKRGMLFVGPTVSVKEVQTKLAEYGVLAEDIQHYKHETSSSFNGLWIATEFSAKGMDIPNLSHVFILGKPASVTAYLHMAGRTGRLGPSGFGQGKVINLVRDHGWNESKMLNLYDLLNIPIDTYQHVE
ncbi:P-loop containing nucleoside triphosphate hydrolase protein, partial [Blakeslea trispora]